MKKQIALVGALAVLTVGVGSANAGGVIRGIGNVFSGHGISDMLNNAQTALKSVFKGIPSPMNALNGIRDLITQKFQSVGSLVKSLTGRPLQGIQNYFKNFSSNLTSGLQGLVGQGLKLGQGLWAQVTGAFHKAVEHGRAEAIKFLGGVTGGKIDSLSGLATFFKDKVTTGLAKIREMAEKKVKYAKAKIMTIFTRERAALNSTIKSLTAAVRAIPKP